MFTYSTLFIRFFVSFAYTTVRLTEDEHEVEDVNVQEPSLTEDPRTEDYIMKTILFKLFPKIFQDFQAIELMSDPVPGQSNLNLCVRYTSDQVHEMHSALRHHDVMAEGIAALGGTVSAGAHRPP